MEAVGTVSVSAVVAFAEVAYENEPRLAVPEAVTVGV